MSQRVEGANVQGAPATLQTLVNTTAGTPLLFNGPNTLSPNAQKRVVGLTNNGAQAATVIVTPYLKSVGPATNVASSSITVPANGVAYCTTAQLASLDEPWDSLQVSVNYATLPAAGTGINVTTSELI